MDGLAWKLLLRGWIGKSIGVQMVMRMRLSGRRSMWNPLVVTMWKVGLVGQVNMFYHQWMGLNMLALVVMKILVMLMENGALQKNQRTANP